MHQVLLLFFREIPASMEPLRPYLTSDLPQSLIGADPSNCLVFLAHSYTDLDLPEVPPHLAVDEPLPYTCVVATPRKDVS